MRQRREAVAAQQGVAELEQCIGAAGAAGVQLGAKRLKLHKRGSWHRHGRAA
jgi:hypothetical protein